jgi:ABC-type cobalamin/Fe3+-siderophores transport system ATPase subunit
LRNKMQVLAVKDFSCIDDATLDLGAVTVLIGPQGTGKSLLCKMVYFFHSWLGDQVNQLTEHNGIDDFKAHLRQVFKEWFPPTAWGSKKFCIEFETGPFEIRITRVEHKGRVSENLRVWFSSPLESHFLKLVERYKHALSKSSKATESFELSWRLREANESAMKSSLGSSYISSQLFIPAGRSFFTSIGKAVFAFEQGGMLDPITIRFGRIFATLRDRSIQTGRLKSRLFTQEAMTELFGGKIVFQRNKEFVETRDGRMIPFSALSSGQQELLPLMLILSQWGVPPAGRQLVYIEEPEAHLFPSAQNSVVEMLCRMTKRSGGKSTIVITTHSPYVAAKINNLIKCGSLLEKFSGNEDKQREIKSVLDSEAAIAPGTVRAYAIKNNCLVSIIDEDELVDAQYLDAASSSISNEFNQLLEIEYGDQSTGVPTKDQGIENQGGREG